jgi:hypothetical protein
MFDILNVGRRLQRLVKTRRGIKVISKEIQYYEFLIGTGLRVSKDQHREYSDLLAYRHKLIDQYNQLRWNWMKAA